MGPLCSWSTGQIIHEVPLRKLHRLSFSLHSILEWCGNFLLAHTFFPKVALACWKPHSRSVMICNVGRNLGAADAIYHNPELLTTALCQGIRRRLRSANLFCPFEEQDPQGYPGKHNFKGFKSEALQNHFEVQALANWLVSRLIVWFVTFRPVRRWRQPCARGMLFLLNLWWLSQGCLLGSNYGGAALSAPLRNSKTMNKGKESHSAVVPGHSLSEHLMLKFQTCLAANGMTESPPGSQVSVFTQCASLPYLSWVSYDRSRSRQSVISFMTQAVERLPFCLQENDTTWCHC